MEHHQPIVFGHHQVLLKIIGALSVGHRFCRQRMLRQIAAGAPVGDDSLSAAAAEKLRVEPASKIPVINVVASVFMRIP